VFSPGAHLGHHGQAVHTAKYRCRGNLCPWTSSRYLGGDRAREVSQNARRCIHLLMSLEPLQPAIPPFNTHYDLRSRSFAEVEFSTVMHGEKGQRKRREVAVGPVKHGTVLMLLEKLSLLPATGTVETPLSPVIRAVQAASRYQPLWGPDRPASLGAWF
jgi:hypothetical protein